MLLTLRAELSPGGDLGHLLHKHPDRVFSTGLGPPTQLVIFSRQEAEV